MCSRSALNGYSPEDLVITQPNGQQGRIREVLYADAQQDYLIFQTTFEESYSVEERTEIQWGEVEEIEDSEEKSRERIRKEKKLEQLRQQRLKEERELEELRQRRKREQEQLERDRQEQEEKLRTQRERERRETAGSERRGRRRGDESQLRRRNQERRSHIREEMDQIEDRAWRTYERSGLSLMDIILFIIGIVIVLYILRLFLG